MKERREATEKGRNRGCERKRAKRETRGDNEGKGKCKREKERELPKMMNKGRRRKTEENIDCSDNLESQEREPAEMER